MSNAKPSSGKGDGLPWYQDGLSFRCSQCGNCCRIEGYVWLNDREIAEMADYLDLELEEFSRRYLRRVNGHISLIEKPNHDCIFWEDGCSVYPVRPTQCRTFPFWPEHLESRDAWNEASRDCPGMVGSSKGGRGGGPRARNRRRYSLAEIEELQRGHGETGPSKGS